MSQNDAIIHERSLTARSWPGIPAGSCKVTRSDRRQRLTVEAAGGPQPGADLALVEVVPLAVVVVRRVLDVQVVAVLVAQLAVLLRSGRETHATWDTGARLNIFNEIEYFYATLTNLDEGPQATWDTG